MVLDPDHLPRPLVHQSLLLPPRKTPRENSHDDVTGKPGSRVTLWTTGGEGKKFTDSYLYYTWSHLLPFIIQNTAEIATFRMFSTKWQSVLSISGEPPSCLRMVVGVYPLIPPFNAPFQGPASGRSWRVLWVLQGWPSLMYQVWPNDIAIWLWSTFMSLGN